MVDDLPPDPWADHTPTPPDPPTLADSSRSSVWQHPALWIGVLVLAVILLIGALLEPPARTTSEPSPDAVTALGAAGRTLA
ncbi:MAG: hypothetical protein WEB09_07600 [Nitriliruptor sp.]